MMIQQFANLLGAVMLCEILIELFKSSAPLAPLRRRIGIEDEFGFPLSCGDASDGKGCAWYSMLAGCGYCMSVWVGVACGLALGLHLFNPAWMPSVLVYALNGLIVHRLSNVWHAVIHRVVDTEGKLRRDMEILGNMSDISPDSDPDPGPDEETMHKGSSL